VWDSRPRLSGRENLGNKAGYFQKPE